MIFYQKSAILCGFLLYMLLTFSACTTLPPDPPTLRYVEMPELATIPNVFVATPKLREKSIADVSAELDAPPRVESVWVDPQLAGQLKAKKIGICGFSSSLTLGGLDLVAIGSLFQDSLRDAYPVASSLVAMLGKGAEGRGAINVSTTASDSATAKPSLIGSPTALLGNRLIVRLLKEGFQSIVDVQGYRQINVELLRTTKSGENVTWRGSLDNMLWVGQVFECDYLLVGTVDIERQSQVYTITPEIDENAATAYENEYKVASAIINSYISEVKRVSEKTKSECDAELEAFKRKLSRWSSESGSNFFVTELPRSTTFSTNIANNEIERLNKFMLAANYAQAAAEEARSKLVSLESIRENIKRKARTYAIPYVITRISLRLIEASSGRIVWLQILEIKNRDLSTALDLANEEIFKGLGKPQKSP